MLKKEAGIYFGFYDSGISKIFELHPSVFKGCYLLITCLDSSVSCERSMRWLEYLADSGMVFRKINCGVLIFPESVQALLADRKTFFGFDEVYVLNGMVDESFVPVDHFTSDLYSFDVGIPESLGRCLNTDNVLGIMADGLGLNVAFNDADTAASFEKTFKIKCNQ